MKNKVENIINDFIYTGGMIILFSLIWIGLINLCDVLDLNNIAFEWFIFIGAPIILLGLASVFITFHYIYKYSKKKTKIINSIFKNSGFVVNILLLIILMLASIRKNITITIEVARSYVGVEWGIFAIIFAFVFMMNTFLITKLENKKVHTNFNNNMLEFAYATFNRRFINDMIRNSIPDALKMVVNVVLLILATFSAYPTGLSEYTIFSQMFVQLSMYYTILNFAFIGGSSFNALRRAYILNQDIDETLEAIENNYMSLYELENQLKILDEVVDHESYIKLSESLKNEKDELDKIIEKAAKKILKI